MNAEIFTSEELEILQNFESGVFVSTLTSERKQQPTQIAELTTAS